MSTPPPDSPRTSKMKDLQPILVAVAIVAGWFVLNRWVLPRFGVST